MDDREISWHRDAFLRRHVYLDLFPLVCKSGFACKRAHWHGKTDKLWIADAELLCDQRSEKKTGYNDRRVTNLANQFGAIAGKSRNWPRWRVLNQRFTGPARIKTRASILFTKCFKLSLVYIARLISCRDPDEIGHISILDIMHIRAIRLNNTFPHVGIISSFRAGIRNCMLHLGQKSPQSIIDTGLPTLSGRLEVINYFGIQPQGNLVLGAGGSRTAALFSPTFLAFFVNFCRLAERCGADIILTGLRFACFGSDREMRPI